MAPEPKKSRRDETIDSIEDSNGENSEVIRFEVAVSDLTPAGIFSPTIEVLGMPWRLKVKKSTRSPFMEVYLFHRTSDCDLWSVDAALNFILFNADKAKNIIKSTSTTFNHNILNWGFDNFGKGEHIFDDAKGFVNDGKIIIEARFTLSNILGIRTIDQIDFSDSNEPCHDVALVIEGGKVYCNKAILAVHSPVLKAMFFGNFAERDKKEIELKDIDRKVFVDMLNLIYPSYKKITDDNAECLLKLADRFQIKAVFDQVEQFLIESSKLTVIPKLNLSDQYRLVKLQEHCLDTFESIDDITNLKPTEGYESLSRNVKATLLEKVMKLNA